MFGRNRIAIVVAEFLGTAALAMVMLSVLRSAISLPYFVAIAAGLTLAVMTVAFARTGDGAHFNPAITIGMWTTRQVKTLPAIAYIIAQLLGAWAAYYLYTYLVRTPLQPSTAHYDAHVLVAEAVGAFILSIGYAAAVFNRFLNAKTAATIGAAFAIGIVVAGNASFGVVNPAVAVTLRAFDVFGSSGWLTYALGPVLGAVIGFNLYALLYAPENGFERVRAVVGERFVRARASAARPAAAAKEDAPAAKPVSRSRTTSSRSKRTTRSRSASTRRTRR